MTTMEKMTEKYDFFQLISEGVQTCTYYAAEKKTAGTSSTAV